MLNTTQPIEVIVTFYGDNAPSSADVAVLATAGITKGVTMNALPIAGVLATPAQINALAANSSVRSLFYNAQLQYDNFDATKLTGVKKAQSHAPFTAANGGLPISGKGITVVINDSGVDGTHPDLQFGTHLVENVMASANLNSFSSILPYTPIAGIPNTDATGGHGTHVAGIVGGSGAASNGLYTGVAPGADLIGYGSGAGLFILDVVSAFDWSITNQFQYGIRVITNSWGTTSDVSTAFNPNDPINISTKKCTDRNIVVVFSAGNSGSGSGTITGNYKKAPWVICVAAGDKQGRLTDFSSRGRKNVGGTVTVGGQQFTWEDRPTVTSPGKDIVSTRTVSPIGLLSTQQDAENLSPAHLAYYTHLDGTSMAAPHVAGIVALMLEADPTLTPYEVKAILQETATNVPGMQSWEVGAGYVNAFAALDKILGNNNYGSTLNYTKTFNGNVNVVSSTNNFTVNFSPMGTSNSFTMNVPAGTSSLEAALKTTGLLGETGNLLNLVLFSPSGQRYSAGIPVTFTLSTNRGVAVSNPEAGVWTVSVEGLQGAALPENVSGFVRLNQNGTTTGLSDVAGHPAENAIVLAVNSRFMDATANGFKPNDNLTRAELAQYLVMGQGVRQSGATGTFTDVTGADVHFVEAAMATGAALRDQSLFGNALLVSKGASTFMPSGTVTRSELAYSIVQSLGLQDYAQSLQGGNVTVDVDGQQITIGDQAGIPAALKGHVQAAINLGLINVFYSITQDPFGLGFTVHADFHPSALVTRAEFAVVATRTFEQYQTPTVGGAAGQAAVRLSVFPNPTTDVLNIELDEMEADADGAVVLMNANGQVVRQINQTLISNDRIQMNVSELPVGMYFLQVTSGETTLFTEKVMVK